ncbi:LysR family transcriptional regulator [Falsiphaeobacter marinintestinus]|uniref:LysR family transcriptional regulator n=1 Tax=Falsiphaeobacter marinintestinus TaxID=1492905 RepID=UPI0011B6F5B4|nr:LysR family transcriptional regulator [Phaeobacter marinintestinus]
MIEKLTQIDLNLFVIFDRIYSERNLTRAAEQLALSQPTVSNALARLRKTLDDPLFVKTQTGMRPTAYAESIRDSVSEALRLLTTSVQETAQFDTARSKRVFRMSIIDLLDAPVLSFLTYLTDPQTTLGFRSFRLNRKEILGALSSGEIDVAVDIALPETGALVRTPYAVDQFVCAMRPDHPLADQPLTLEAYLAAAHIHVSGRKNGGGPVDIALRRKGLKRRITAQLQSHVAAPALVQSSDYLITAPSAWAAGHGLLLKPLPLPVDPLATYLYRHRRSDGDAAILWLYDQIRSHSPLV